MIDRNKAKAISNAIAEVLAASNHPDLEDVNIYMGNGTYDPPNAATFKVEVRSVNEDGTVYSEEAEAFKTMAHLYGLKSEWLGAKFMAAGIEYTISGLAKRSRKFPILAKRVKDGKTFKFTEDVVKRLVMVAGV